VGLIDSIEVTSARSGRVKPIGSFKGAQGWIALTQSRARSPSPDDKWMDPLLNNIYIYIYIISPTCTYSTSHSDRPGGSRPCGSEK
jgi:hypothetical protein